ncbi:hypothetical protein MLD52_20985, partial [Puniceicoccaceae bacterium K14]|nr:hypothetical protein [Puniceicoccaceae bacterium K14]
MKLFQISLLSVLAWLCVTSNSIAQNYPLSPDEIGLVGAEIDSATDLTVISNAGEVHLTTGVYEYIHWENANIWIDGDDVVIRKCLITWNGEDFAVVRNGGAYDGLLIEDSEIDGQGYTGSSGIWPGSYKLIRSYVHNVGDDALKANGGVEIHRSWIGPLVMTETGPHNDVLQTVDNPVDLPIIITCSTFYGHLTTGGPVNVNCLRFGGTGSKGDVVIVNNLLSGAVNQIHIDGDSDDSFLVKDNVFEDSVSAAAVYPNSAAVNLIWENNTYASNGTLVAFPTSSGDTSIDQGTVPTISYPACTGTFGGGIQIAEDFSSESSDFTAVSGGSWDVSAGRYVLTSPATGGAGLLGNLSVHSVMLSGDYTASAIVNITGTTSVWNDAAIVFDFQDAGNYYFVSLNESDDGDTMGVFRVEGGVSTEIFDLAGLSIVSDTDYVLEVVRSGSLIVVSLDGSQVVSVSDGAFSGGQIGFGSRNDGAQFDDILVSFAEDSESPSVPTGLASSNVGETSVDFDWVASTGNVIASATISATTAAVGSGDLFESVGTGTSGDVSSYTGWDNPGGWTYAETEEDPNCRVAVVSSNYTAGSGGSA